MPKLEHLDKIYEDHKALFLKKMGDYGTKDITEVGLDGVVSRLVDKFARLRNLLGKRKEGGEPNLESVDDTLQDIIGYSVIALLLERGQWEETGENGRILVGPKSEGPNKTDTKESESIKSEGYQVLITRTEEAKKFDLPNPKKPGDVGHDLFTVKDTVIPAFNTTPVNIETGVAIKLPAGHWADIRCRSSAGRRGIEVVACVIDEGYTGPLYACCYNRTNEDITVKAGERVAQFVVHKSSVFPVVEVDKLPETERGAAGFGSTGV